MPTALREAETVREFEAANSGKFEVRRIWTYGECGRRFQILVDPLFSRAVASLELPDSLTALREAVRELGATAEALRLSRAPTAAYSVCRPNRIGNWRARLSKLNRGTQGTSSLRIPEQPQRSCPGHLSRTRAHRGHHALR